MRIILPLTALAMATSACTDSGSRCRKTANLYEKCLARMTEGEADPNLSEACEPLDGIEVDEDEAAFWNCADRTISNFECASYDLVEGNIALGVEIAASCGEDWPW